MMITTDQVAALAPDAAVLADGRKIAASKSWTGEGRSNRAAWGECRGSALYQVRADLGDLATKCSCPSRKFPCKHGVALLLLLAGGGVREAAEPVWVAEWLAKRVEAAAKREEKREKPDAAPDPEAQARRAAKRHERVLEGLDALDLWMEDLVRGGFTAIQRQRPSVFEAQAARLVDAQAPGLASRLRRLDADCGATASTNEDAASRLLAGLGGVALLTHAYRRIDALDAGLAADVRQAVGFAVELDEVAATGERVSDDWLVLGSWTEDDDRVRAQRTWLRGLGTDRDALVLQFAAAGATFGQTFSALSRFSAELAFWPGAWPQRALVRGERGHPSWFDGRIPGHATIDQFLDALAAALAHQPWLDRVACCLHDVTLGSPPTSLADRDGHAIRLSGHSAWDILARSGGRTLDVVGEWDGTALRPILWRIDGKFVRGQGVS